MTVNVQRYQPTDRQVWDVFIKESKNGVFLFERNYMDYHAERFADHSLLFYKEEELLAVLPANEKEGTLHSHGGLTFGGFVMSKRASVVFVLAAFEQLVVYMKAQNLDTLIYKSIPAIYHNQPAAEDLYALFRSNAQLYRRDANCVIDLSQKVHYTKGTKSNLSKARKAGLTVQESQDFSLFMKIEEEILMTKYGTRPVHTASELEMLSARFPEQIRLFLVYASEECLGGTVLYITANVVHTQYIGITDNGKETGALDFLTDKLLQDYCAGKRYFSFGISTEQEGRYLNEGLVRNKESFGARTLVNDFYRLQITE